jgi:hypothetical protein
MASPRHSSRALTQIELAPPRTLGFGRCVRRWRRATRDYLRQYPLCEVATCGKQSVLTHRLDGRGLAGPRAFDPTNWMAVCNQHHGAAHHALKHGLPRP